MKNDRWTCRAVAMFAALAFILVAPQPVLSEEASADKTAAAADLLDAMGGMDQARGTIERLKTGMIRDMTKRSPKIAPAFSSFLEKELNPDSARVTAYLQGIETLAKKFYTENFTVAEMKAVADFQRSDAGRKFQSKAPDLLQAMTPLMMQFQKDLIKDVLGTQGSAATGKN